jgi:general secretion pathway protein F/type IV pilus assembly protein PilC
VGTFAYIARTASGDRVTGTLVGATEQAVLSELQARSLAPVEVRPVVRRSRRRVSTRQLATAYRQISDLLRAGVPLLRALRLLGRSRANPRLAEVMNEVADEVADGGHLAESMARHDDVFPPVQIAMVRAGERGGFLEQVLERLGTFLEHQADLRGKVVGNLVYPIALLTVGAGIIVFALVFLVPKFESFYSRIALPLPTRMLLGSSSLLVDRWPQLLVAIGAVVAAAWWALRRPGVRRRLALWQLRVPKLGALARDLAVGRFTRILGTLLENGIPMLPAMQISREATGHVLLTDAIEKATEAVRAGETLAQPLAESGMFSDDAVEIISVGESANNLPVVLITLADTIEKRVDRVLGALVRLMEPLLLLGMAGMVLFIFVALVVPMLRMSSSL